ncbi:MAG: DUF885 domain-containing protein [Candidatus Dormibacteria bacterium]|jgi:uncharacterized protein (DUF885 family)
MSSPVHELCDAYVERLAAADPAMATQRGLMGHDAHLTDYSPAGAASRTDLDRSTLRELLTLPIEGKDDRVAAALLSEWLESRLALDEAGETQRTLSVIGSPWQSIRQAFDLMPRESERDWETIAARLERVPGSLRGLRAALQETTERQMPPARRQVLACAEQGSTWAGERGGASFFAGLVGRYGGDDDRLRRRLAAAATAAAGAYADAAGWMREELAPSALERDPVGPDRYALTARQNLGASVDLLETYAWGWEEVHRLEAEMAREATRIIPGASLTDVIDVLESDPARAAHGEDALRVFLQNLMDRTIADLNGSHFDIPAPLTKVEAMIAPPGGAAAAYYTGPAEDFSRPGRTWYPTQGRTVFPLWGEVTTCYHEGVPGHHLQVGQVRYRRDRLTRFQRSVWISGHGEGWALYAERLMDELGYLDRPEYRLGFLHAQLLRAIRVVVDIGMHLELRIPVEERFHPGEMWTPELGRDFLFTRLCSPRDFLASELDRYLGRPGQAIAYKVGERAWLAARDAARQRLGPAFDLKSFHAAALDLGPLGLDRLAAECAAWVGDSATDGS